MYAVTRICTQNELYTIEQQIYQILSHTASNVMEAIIECHLIES